MRSLLDRRPPGRRRRSPCGQRRRPSDKAYDASTVLATVNGNADHARPRDRPARPAAAAVPEPAGRRADERAGRPARRPGAARRGAVGLARERSAAGEAGRRQRAPRRAGRASPPTRRWPTRWTTPRCRPPTTSEIAAFQPAPEFNAAHILVDSEEKAKALKAEIDGGKDFAEVAKANSSDGSAANGGDLGWFGARARWCRSSRRRWRRCRSAQVVRAGQDASSAGT